MLKLPKNVLTSPTAAAVEKLFISTEQRLRFGGKVTISRWVFSQKVRAALSDVIIGRHLVQSLEVIGTTLDRELKGLLAVQQKAEKAPTERLSRLLLLSSDGSDRFYHDAESLLLRHGQRTWCCVLDATGEQLGHAIKPGGAAAKALLIADRKALELFLLSLVH
jgi:hypothetical protein